MYEKDDEYIKIIEGTRYLNENTKKMYIKKIKVIIEEIMPNNRIKNVLENPEYFDERLKIYCESQKGRINEKISDHTIESYYKPIIAIFNYDQELKERNIGLLKEWKKIQEKSKMIIDKKYKSNEPSLRQINSYIDYDMIIDKRNLLNEGSYERLLLMMYTEIPPLRCDYYKIRILKKIPDILNENENLLIMSESQSIIILTKYKTSKKYGTLFINIPDSLINEIKSSLSKFPRDFLFVSKSGKPYNNENTFNHWANKTLKIILGNNNISLTTLRHIYISRRDLKLEDKSGLEQEIIAKQMGHSIEQQRKYLWHTWLNKKTILENISN